MNVFKKGELYIQQFNVTPDVYKSFQDCSNDKNPLHTDEIFAKEKGFEERVMYGNILNTFISYFIGECLPTQNVIIIYQDISYKKPFYLNDILHLESVIDGIFESVNTVEIKFKFINQKNDVIAKGHVQIGILQ